MAAVAVAVAVAVAAVVMYFAAKVFLARQVMDSLHAQAAQAQVEIQPPGQVIRFLGSPFGGTEDYYQVISDDGKPQLANGETTPLPVTADDLAVARGSSDETSRDVWFQGVHLQILTIHEEVPVRGSRLAEPLTLEIAQPLTTVDHTLALLKLLLFGVTAGGVALAAVMGWLIAKAAMRPVYRLRAAVDRVTETRDMRVKVPDEGNDELARLGAHFNRMLTALDQSLRMQRQLVADASHELRTPLTSLRTNIEVLQRSPDLPEGEREKLLRDLVSQVEQLTRLIQDLIDLARGDQTPEEEEEVRLDWVVAAAVERAATNWPSVQFDAQLVESVVVGQAGRLDRAVSNLLDNAGKWSREGQVVEVRVEDHELVVRDHGPGIEPSDLPYVFDRFWRAPGARGMPGSGLGLAIVRQVADAHHATVTAELPPDGGTLMRLRFPAMGAEQAVLSLL